jgi:glycosyltransferase involved in cell wall biosynthesis
VRVALDATYSVDPRPSGIAVYSSEILAGLASAYPDDEFIHCYRPKKYWNAPRDRLPNVRRRLLLSSFATFRADIFHALNQRLDARRARRVVCTFHDLFVFTADYSSPQFRARFIAQAQEAARNADLIIAVSSFTAAQIAALLPVEPERIRVVPHGVHLPDVVLPPDAVLSEDRREKIVLFVGALQIRKNLVRLIEAFEALPADWRLILAGALAGYGAAAPIERAANSPAAGRIQIAGYLAPHELRQLYARASIFAFPSLDEGFGIPVLEAMAHEIPVVTSNCSALPEVAGDAALLVNPLDSSEIAHALTRLTSDCGLRRELAKRGRQRAGNYSWQRAVAATYSVYREIT